MFLEHLNQIIESQANEVIRNTRPLCTLRNNCFSYTSPLKYCCSNHLLLQVKIFLTARFIWRQDLSITYPPRKFLLMERKFLQRSENKRVV